MKMLNLVRHSADEFDTDRDRDKLHNIMIITVACMFLHLFVEDYCKQKD